MSSGEVVWNCKGWCLGLDTSVLVFSQHCGIPARGLLSAVVVEHKQPGQGTGCTCGAGVAPLSNSCSFAPLEEGVTPALALGLRPSQTQKRTHNCLHTSQNSLGPTRKPSSVSPLCMMCGLFTVHTGIASEKVKLGQASYCVSLAHKYLRYVAQLTTVVAGCTLLFQKMI